MLTSRENLLRIFRHETPEWLPVCGHVDPYAQPSRIGMDPALAEALGEVKWGGEATVTFSRWLGLDIMDWYGIPIRIARNKVAVETKTTGDETTLVWHTPKGDLRETIRLCRDPSGAQSSCRTEHLVKGPQDIPALVAIFEDERNEPDSAALERTCQRRRLIGDDGLLLGVMDGTPLGMMYRVFSGVETLAYLWADAPAALHDLFAVMEAGYLRRMALAVQSDIDVVVGVDDTSTTVISPAMFEACNMGLTDARARLAHEHGKFYFHHSCGLIRNLLPLYRRTQMDAVHAFTVPPTGDATIADGRRLLGERVAVIAGVMQFAGSMDNCAAVRDAIRGMILEADGWPRLILYVSGRTNRTMEETQFVVDCCRDYKEVVPR